MSDSFAQFEKRLECLERKHRELAHGYVAKINPDGLITVQPKERQSGLALRLILAVVMAVMLFKSVTLAIVGPSVYETRLQSLLDGIWFEKACAWVMQIDPVTLAIAEFFARTFG